MNLSILVKGDLAYSQPDWLKYLETHTSFRYESANDPSIRFAASKDANGYWTAKKKVGGKLRQKRLGNSLALSKRSADELYQIALMLSEGSVKKEEKRSVALALVEAEMLQIENCKTNERVKLAWEVLSRLKEQLS